MPQKMEEGAGKAVACGRPFCLLSASYMPAGSSQLYVQGSKTNQIIELGIRTVGNLRWLVRPQKCRTLTKATGRPATV